MQNQLHHLINPTMQNQLYHFINSTFFDQWQIKLGTFVQNECIQYNFSIYVQETHQLQYLSHQYYSNEEEAISKAYFLCLRAFLDREKYPTLIVDTLSGEILSINLPAFMLFSMDAVGLHTIDLTLDSQQHEQIYQKLRQTGTVEQPILLCDGDGKAITCQIQARIDNHYCQWAIFQIFTYSNNFEISH